MSLTPAVRPSEEEVREELRLILDSPQFAGARRLSRFLEFVVSTSLHDAEVKESLIGVEVFGRDPSYNPKADSIVRTEASRLRARLREYYEGEGRDDPVRIELPKGCYRPVFEHNAISRPAGPPPPARRSRRRLAVTLLPAGILLAAAWWLTVRGPKPHSIAVAPLAIVGSDRSVNSLADGLSEGMTRVLLASNRWRVAGGNSSRNLIGTNRAAAAWARESGAEVVLAGSLRAEENSVLSLTLQLMNAADGYVLWSGVYQRQMAYFTSARLEFARDVVDEFTEKFTGRALSPASRYYLQARESWNASTGQGLERSIVLFEQAIRADSKFAPAWAGLAEANYRLDRVALGARPDNTEAARKAAIKAIALDEANAEAHEVLGNILSNEWDFPGAARELGSAVAADPLRVPAAVGYSRNLVFTGQMVTAAEVIATARARLPNSPTLLFQDACIHFNARHFQKMESLGRELIVLAPDKGWGRWLVGLALEQRGEVKQAIEEFQLGLQQSARDDLRILCSLGHAYGLVGDRRKAIDTMRRYLDPDEHGSRTTCLCAALTYTGLNERDRAFEWLEKARAVKDTSFPYFPLDFRFDPLRGDPRYARLATGLYVPGTPTTELSEPLAK